MYVADQSDDKVYSYKMPDAIDDRLASLTLSGVEVGEFSPRKTEYAGVPGESVTETTVEAEAMQRRTTVVIEPADNDGDSENGYQVALAGVGEITARVTSADGSRKQVYRVALGAGPEPAAPAGLTLDLRAGGDLIAKWARTCCDSPAAPWAGRAGRKFGDLDRRLQPMALAGGDAI